ncbi:ProQ/FinO family protein [Roseateles sp.]|uniref:ProQ/FinO family protein n=1 Tax=Roseateles sp. TaxID=1971397 RepID=UPI0032667FDA
MNSDLPDPVTPFEEPAAAVPAPEAQPAVEAVAPAEAVEPAEAEEPAASVEPAAAAASSTPAVDATAELKALFPALFTGKPKPVKLRVQADIQERAPGKFSKAQLSAFLRRHTGSTSYLIALTQAKTRFDLDGNPAGEITEEHLAAAKEELTRRKGLQQERQQLEQEQHQLEAQQRRNRGQLLWDFERTTLTEANFCVLKGVVAEELPGLLEIARKERTEAPPAPPQDARRDGPRRDDRRPAAGRPEGRGERRPDQRADGRRDGKREAPRGERREGGRPPQPARNPAPQLPEQAAPSQMAQALQAAKAAKAEPATDAASVDAQARDRAAD